MASDTYSLAAWLGIDESTIRRLQSRGHLLGLDLTEREIRTRLYDGHIAWLAQHRRQLAETARFP